MRPRDLRRTVFALVNQWHDFGEFEFHRYVERAGQPGPRPRTSRRDAEGTPTKADARRVQSASTKTTSKRKAKGFVLKSDPSIKIARPRVQDDSKTPQRRQSRRRVRDYGADSLALCMKVHGPLESHQAWVMNGVGGCPRFLDRGYGVGWSDDKADELALSRRRRRHAMRRSAMRVLAQTIRKVTRRYEGMSISIPRIVQ